MIKAICFDLDGVYFTPEGIRNFIHSIASLGTTIEKAEFVMFKSEEMKQLKHGKILENEFWDFAREYWNIQKSDQEFKDILASGYSIDKSVEKVVLQAKEKGYKTCICSNNFHSRIESLENKFKFLKNFDVQIFSYKVGVTKPDKKIFEKLIEAAQVNPSEIIYSDDNEEKLKGALELGINAFVYDGHGEFLMNLEKLGIIL
jgi:epoxide hydrolase-like predicted phosphatase